MHALEGRARKAGAVFVVLALSLTIMAVGFPYPQRAQAAYVDPTNYVIGLKTPAKITKLIYPTIGNPAIVKRGTTFTAEFDPREGKFYDPALGKIKLPSCSGWTASVTTRNSDPSVPTITRSLEVVDAVSGYSAVWPLLKSGGGVDRRVYKVTINVPATLPAHLYDLTISTKIEGSTYADTQTNSLDVIKEFKEKFNFVQLSDIHVYGPENTDASIFYSHSRKERVARRTSYDAGPTGQGWGSTYLHKEIMEINRLRPDFCVFTGDYDFGQRYFQQTDGQRGYGSWGTMTQYEWEQSWFYQEIQALEVPVFIVIGNHDGYNYASSFGAPVDQDWFTNWTRLYGPLYFTFNYGPDNRFFAVNTMDWSTDDRALQDFLLIMQPVKYLGAGLAGGDLFAAGVSQQRLNAVNTGTFTQQLGWLRDQLAASSNCKVRVMAMHHDPWKDNGSGSMWASADNASWISNITGMLDMGDGPGRLALIKLATTFKVALMVHGHDHSDCTSEDDTNRGLLTWSGGGGRTISQNTTSASFQGDGNSTEYPGYRRVWIDNGAVVASGNESLNYVETGVRSWPFYKDTVVNGTTNLGGLSIPAVQQTWSAARDGSQENLDCALASDYTKPLSDLYMDFPMKYLSGGYYYTVTNGTQGEMYDIGTSSRVLQVTADLTAKPNSKTVMVRKSATADTTAPAGSLKINDGASTTNTVGVTLTTSATDTGGSGLGLMMVSESPDFTGAIWEAYQPTRAFTLSPAAGTKRVYVKYRDGAMPPNTSATYSAAINYDPYAPTPGNNKVWYLTPK
jgi:3',5'-cyclic AMP phosphodiesterase CpdA